MEGQVLLELAIRITSSASIEHTIKSVAASMGLNLRLDRNAEQIVLGGCSERVLSTLLAVLHDELGNRISTDGVRLAYRESVSGPADVDFTHKRQSGGDGEFARVIIEVAPAWLGAELHNDVPDGHLPSEYIQAAARGARGVTGPLGMPLAAIDIRLKDGTYHDLDSSPRAFETAARCALAEAIRRAGVRVLEPLATVALLTRRQHLTAIADELAQRGAEVLENNLGETPVLSASSRMRDLLGLEAQLHSMTGGEAKPIFILSGYAEVPPSEPPKTTPAIAVNGI